MELKKCAKCGIEKNVSSFYKRPERIKNPYRSYCKSCCKILKPSKEKQREYCNKSRHKDIDAYNKNKREYRIKNKELILSIEQKYRDKNKVILNKKSVEYTRERRKTDPLFKVKYNISNLIYVKIKNKGYTKESKTEKILGCTYIVFKNHIENQFDKGMTWDNHGEWHLDHIKPISLATNESEVIELNHYKNFQPLWAIDNLRKSNKY